MDKKQKELIKTYYRKRNIAAERIDKYSFNDYEVNAIVKDPYVIEEYFKDESGNIDGNLIADFLIKSPNLIDLFYKNPDMLMHEDIYKTVIKSFNLQNKNFILKFLSKINPNIPNIHAYIKNIDFNILNSNDIFKILMNNPKMATYFNNKKLINILNDEQLKSISIKYPKFYVLLKIVDDYNIDNKFTKEEKRIMIEKEPEMEKVFNI